MSWRAVAWAFAQPTATHIEKLVLVAIAHHASKHDHTAWPNQETLAQETGLSPRTVVRAVQSLREVRLVSTERRPGSRGQWAYLVYRLPVTESPRAAQDRVPHSHVVHVSPSHTDRVTPTTSTIRHTGHPPCATQSHKPFIEPSSEPLVGI